MSALGKAVDVLRDALEAHQSEEPHNSDMCSACWLARDAIAEARSVCGHFAEDGETPACGERDCAPCERDRAERASWASYCASQLADREALSLPSDASDEEVMFAALELK